MQESRENQPKYTASELENLLQEQFPQEAGLCYLNHAAVSPWPKVTSEAISDFALENCTSGALHYPRWMAKEQELRSKLARLLNLSGHHEVALAKSTSEALSIIAYGLNWQAGDEIVISSHEFPSNRIVWESLADQGVTVIEADFSCDDPLQALASKITTKTRLVSVSTVQYASGIRLNCDALGKLCREHDVMLCLDAIQSLGAFPLDQQRVQADFIVGDGHKWMMAAEGLALLYVAQKHLNTLKLNQFGWHMVKHKGDYDRHAWEPSEDATRFECGSPNMLGTYALNASLGLLLDIGIDQVSALLEQKVSYLIEKLMQIPGLTILSPQEAASRGGIVTFRLDQTDHKTLYQKLMQAKVVCAHRGGGIRFSPGFYTSYEVIDEAIKRLCDLIPDAAQVR